MTWYCAHVIIGMHKKGSLSPIEVYENVFLIEANSSQEACEQAELFGQVEADLDDGITIDDVPAIRVFAGIRKLISISNPGPSQDKTPPVHGTELTYSEYQVPDMETLMKLGKGETVDVRYFE